MFNLVSARLRASKRAFLILTLPILPLAYSAALTNNALVALLATCLSLWIVWFAYQAGVRNPLRYDIWIDQDKMQLRIGDHLLPLWIRNSLWLGSRWGLCRLMDDHGKEHVILLAPYTLSKENEFRRLRVHFTHNKRLLYPVGSLNTP